MLKNRQYGFKEGDWVNPALPTDKDEERKTMRLLDRIQTDPTICHGAACIKGTRIMVSVVLDTLAEGHSVEEILTEYPTLTVTDIHAAMAFGAWLARDLSLPLPPLEGH
jgi:uncharacterized protein (DUF433 family)